jgi:thiazole biosynthesis/tRNA modification protein ThiI
LKRILIKFSSEISLKGLNRKNFENMLIKDIRDKIGRENKIIKDYGRIYIDTPNASSDEIITKLSKTFGIISVVEADVVEKDLAAIGAAAIEQLKIANGISTFKVATKRGDKKFPISSVEVSKRVGGIILESIPQLKVDVHKPQIIVNVEIRDFAYIYTNEVKGIGGMPYKTSGKGILLLSGGIDSPVAGYMMAKRGLEIIAVYYHSHPYTSERAKQKVIDLAEKLAEYTGLVKLYIVPFTNIQMDIIEKCREDELTIIMRRFMMKIAEKVAEDEGALSIITGESLGQVASQTLESIYVTDNIVSVPVFRPLIGSDKVDIIDVSREIGTYDISILPYEDCCTIFVPKHPKTKPRLSDIDRSEGLLDMPKLIEEAVNGAEIINAAAK